MRQLLKRFTGSFAIDASQSHGGVCVCKRGRRQTGVDCGRHARRAHRLHRSVRADARCSGSGGTLAQKTAFGILDAGPATRSAAIDTDVKLSVIR
jgi:hypothetical protein